PAPEYELVAGERRWRACQLAKLTQIPAMIRPMTDEQALEAQVIENLQREDVTELEEAEGYETLMKHSALNADQVGAKIGKSRGYVYGRLKLLDLCQQAREALREGKIDFSKALMAARIPNEPLQIKAVAFMTKPDWQGDIPSYRECAKHVQNEYMLRLDTARFKIADASLVPAAGSCTDCKKRTGAEPDLFHDIDSADVCTDPKCFHDKTDAHTALMVQEAQAKGHTVIVGQEAAELATEGYNTKIKGYRRLDTAEDSPTSEPLRKIIGAQMKAEGIQPVKIENPRKKGELIDALPNETVLRLLKVVDGQAQASKEVAKEVRAFADEKKAKAEAKAKGQYERAWRDGLIDRAWTAITSESIAAFTIDVHRYLALRMVKNLSTDDVAAVADVLGLDRVGAHSALIQHAAETVHPDWLQMLCIMQMDSSVNDHSYGGRIANEGLMLVAGAALQKQLQTAIKDLKAVAAEKHLPKPAPVKSDAPKPDLPQHPAARAGGDGGKGKAQKSKKPAAHAGEVPKTSAAHASALIAAALQEADSGAAAAAQGNDAAPVADAQAPITGADALGNEAAPVAAAAAHGLPPSATADCDDQDNDPSAQQPAGAQAATAIDGQDSADVNTGPAMAIGMRVRVNESANGKKQKPWVDHFGTVEAQLGPEAWDVAIERAPRCKPLRVAFHTTELEIAT
ncbi:MAG: ParB/RepB/Spo0J family partition protein, partial [Comamonas sp.]